MAGTARALQVLPYEAQVWSLAYGYPVIHLDGKLVCEIAVRTVSANLTERVTCQLKLT